MTTIYIQDILLSPKLEQIPAVVCSSILNNSFEETSLRGINEGWLCLCVHKVIIFSALFEMFHPNTVEFENQYLWMQLKIFERIRQLYVRQIHKQSMQLE